MKDYYSILNVKKDSPPDEIKKAYKRLASKYHPDRNKDKEATSKFQEAQEAYDNLSDPNKRSQYDAMRSGGVHFSFEDIMRGFSHARQSSAKIYTVSVSLEEAYTGTVISNAELSVGIPAGIRSGNKLIQNGVIFSVHVTPHHKFKRSNDDLLVDVEISAFEAMLGIDVTLLHIDKNKVKFKIPPGIQFGQIIRLAGKGMPNPETDAKGDLLIRCGVVIPMLTSEERERILNIHNRNSIEI